MVLLVDSYRIEVLSIDDEIRFEWIEEIGSSGVLTWCWCGNGEDGERTVVCVLMVGCCFCFLLLLLLLNNF